LWVHYMVHDHTLTGIEGQGHGSRSTVSVKVGVRVEY